MQNRILLSLFLLLALMLNFSCNPEPSVTPIGFEGSAWTVNESGTGKEIKIVFSLPSHRTDTLLVIISDLGAVYGQDYTTSPAPSGNTIFLVVHKGDESASFQVNPILNSAFDGDQLVSFTIGSNLQNAPTGSINQTIVTIVDDDLVCYLPMYGDAIDHSHFSNPVFGNFGTQEIGKDDVPGTAIWLDSLFDFAILNSTALDSLEQVTLTGWFKPVSFTGQGNNGIIEKPYTSHTNPYYQYKLGLTGDSYGNHPSTFDFSLSINMNYNVLISPSAAWIPEHWYFVAGTYDGTDMKMYINGELASTQSAPGAIDHFGQDLHIGETFNVRRHTPGTFGAMRIYNRALSAEEIQALYLR